MFFLVVLSLETILNTAGRHISTEVLIQLHQLVLDLLDLTAQFIRAILWILDIALIVKYKYVKAISRSGKVVLNSVNPIF